ncbi:unnamed protein product [Cuscuta campestris]|uniref:BHLH domain-containing protein n=1 Tax=Cuscuta campestris TaxID=132261 RepID=A0A484K1K5_9ASTE|nr:unnamed protein product [Cuscuta campestris]
MFEYDDGWKNQFSAGIKTIAVVGVGPLGVVQLGSLDEVPENLKMVKDIRDVFFLEARGSMDGAHLHSAMPNNVETCVSDMYTRTSSSEAYLYCMNNQSRSVENGTHVISSEDASLGQGQHNHHSRIDNKVHEEVPNKHEREVQMQEAIPTMSELQASNYLTDSILEDNEKCLKHNNTSDKVIDPNELFSLPNLLNASLHKDTENNTFQPTDMNTIQTPLSYNYPGWELYEALGPAFQRVSDVTLWETEKFEMEPEVTGDSSLLMSESTTDHLLEAVVGNVSCYQESDASSVAKSFSKPVEVREPCSSDVGTLSSAGYSFSSSGAHLERQQEPIRRMSKKRAKPGESCRPRPRDRQLIQERIKELRDLVPNGSKCSIDSLLERAIQHMLYMQSVTKHDEMLNECNASKWLGRESVTHKERSYKEKGSSWAVEVGSDLRVCPIIVENLSTNGHMIVEMLLKDCSHFLEIAEAIRSLELTILKGVAEAYGEKTRMLFVVEGQENRAVHRMDVLLSLMQLISPGIIV